MGELLMLRGRVTDRTGRPVWRRTGWASCEAALSKLEPYTTCARSPDAQRTVAEEDQAR